VLRERQDRPRGGPDAPLTRGEIEAKFRGNAGLALPPAQIEQVISATSTLEDAGSLAGLLASLTP
jgi:hypothetical protein